MLIISLTLLVLFLTYYCYSQFSRSLAIHTRIHILNQLRFLRYFNYKYLNAWNCLAEDIRQLNIKERVQALRIAKYTPQELALENYCFGLVTDTGQLLERIKSERNITLLDQWGTQIIGHQLNATEIYLTRQLKCILWKNQQYLFQGLQVLSALKFYTCAIDLFYSLAKLKRSFSLDDYSELLLIFILNQQPEEALSLACQLMGKPTQGHSQYRCLFTLLGPNENIYNSAMQIFYQQGCFSQMITLYQSVGQITLIDQLIEASINLSNLKQAKLLLLVHQNPPFELLESYCKKASYQNQIEDTMAILTHLNNQSYLLTQEQFQKLSALYIQKQVREILLHLFHGLEIIVDDQSYDGSAEPSSQSDTPMGLDELSNRLSVKNKLSWKSIQISPTIEEIVKVKFN